MENMDLKRRLYLQSLLKELPEVREAYFQLPEDTHLVYPCIMYKWDKNLEIRADDRLYISRRGYMVIIIDENPDSIIPGIFQRNFPMASLERTYVSDNLNHWVYNLYW